MNVFMNSEGKFLRFYQSTALAHSTMAKWVFDWTVDINKATVAICVPKNKRWEKGNNPVKLVVRTLPATSHTVTTVTLVKDDQL